MPTIEDLAGSEQESCKLRSRDELAPLGSVTRVGAATKTVTYPPQQHNDDSDPTGMPAAAKRRGTATHIAMTPAVLGQQKSLGDTQSHPLYPEAGTTFAGLTTVTAVSASQPFIFDSSWLFLVRRSDFSVDLSDQTEEAWSHCGLSLRLVGRFTVAAPAPVMTLRKLTVSGVAPSATESKTTEAPAKKAGATKSA